MIELIIKYLLFFVFGVFFGAIEGWNKQWGKNAWWFIGGYLFFAILHGDFFYSLSLQNHGMSNWHWIPLIFTMWVPWHYTEKWVRGCKLRREQRKKYGVFNKTFLREIYMDCIRECTLEDYSITLDFLYKYMIRRFDFWEDEQ